MSKLRYSEFRDQLDVDALEEAIGFVPRSIDRGNDTGTCLFPENHSHGDTTGKFAIHRDKKVYNCFVCGGGSLLSLVMELYDYDVDTATEWLYQYTDDVSVHTNVDFELAMLKEMAEDAKVRADTMPYFNERVLERFNDPTTWFTTRGISDEIVEQYHLRASATALKPAPVKNGEKIDEDYIGPAIVFPHYWEGKLVGWQHRWLAYDAGETPRWLPKYTMTTDFPKRNTLFNYHNVLRTHDKILVCESVPTVLFLASLGYPAVSYFGGEVTPEQLRKLLGFRQGVILCPDNDKVGDKLLSIATPVLERRVPVWHLPKVSLGPKADLGDFAKADHPSMRVYEFLQRAYQPGDEV